MSTLKKFLITFQLVLFFIYPYELSAEKKEGKAKKNTSLTAFTKEFSRNKENVENRIEEEKKIMALVKKALLEMVEPVEVFKGPGNIKGVIVKNKNNGSNRLPVWVVDKKYVLLGDISDDKGQIVSRFSYLSHLISKDITKEALVSVSGVKLTKGKRRILIFADPDCPFCNKLYKDIKKTGLSKFEKSELQIEWIPVSLSSVGKSNKKAVAILKGGVNAIENNEKKYNYSIKSGGVTGVAPETNLELALKVKNNTETLRQFDEGRGAMTPTIVWDDKEGNRRVQVGAPKSTDIFFN